MATSFDAIAEEYSRTSPEPAEELVGLVLAEAGFHSPAKVVDLGCGSGRLALSFATHGHSVVGVDSSDVMITLARKADCGGLVQWVNTDVQHFEFGREECDLVFSYEAFHLFRNQGLLLRRIVTGLRPGGCFVVAWTDYGWQDLLYEAISCCFSAFGVSWVDWGYWRCPGLAQLVSDGTARLSEMKCVSLTSQSSSTVASIAEFLASIEKSAHLGQHQRCRLRQCIEHRARETFCGELFTGESVTTIAIARKLHAGVQPTVSSARSNK